MSLHFRYREIFGITDSSLTLSWALEDDSGPADVASGLFIDGESRAEFGSTDETRLVRVEGLEPGTDYRIEIRASGLTPETPDPDEPKRYFSDTVRTLPAPAAGQVASFATLNDLHFGEPKVGGVLTDDHEYGDAAPGFPEVRADDTDVPYSHFMNEDAIAEINRLDVDATIIKGDIANRGQAEEFETAAKTFSALSMPHHAFLGNHDYYARLEGVEIDGYALLGQPPAPRSVDLGGWRLILLETALPGDHHGVFPEERRSWLADALAEVRELEMPTLLLMHHQPVPPEHAQSYPNSIGLLPEHSLRFFDLVGECPQVKGVLIGHTHRNRVRRNPASGSVPYIEVNCTKDYPGGFAHYRLFEDGSFRQEVRRTGSDRALAHSEKCRGLFRGLYRDFALGGLASRSFVCG